MLTPDAGFGEIRRRAESGAPLNVVFFGASLTWGANASDPQLTSYRARLAEHLRDAYPTARFRFWDAAIGGTGSQLGTFRLERDVLARDPDLVFLDFTANDGMTENDAERLASYESIVRRLVSRGITVMLVILPTRSHVEGESLADLPRREAHLKIAEAYNLPAADAVAFTHHAIRSGRVTPETIWPWEPVHPGDAGYALYAEAAWETTRAALRSGTRPRVPEKMLHGDQYLHVRRALLTDLADAPPPGWAFDSARRTAAWYDGLMTRWLERVAVARGSDGRAPAPLRIRFRGSMVGVFGEETIRSGGYRATLDGQPLLFNGKPIVNVSSKTMGGNRQHWRVLATGLAEDREHELILEPVLAGDEANELRLESICVAGSRPPEVTLLEPASR